MVEQFDAEKTVNLVWCRDSETGEHVLVDRTTNKEVYRGTERINKGTK